MTSFAENNWNLRVLIQIANIQPKLTTYGTKEVNNLEMNRVPTISHEDNCFHSAFPWMTSLLKSKVYTSTLFYTCTRHTAVVTTVTYGLDEGEGDGGRWYTPSPSPKVLTAAAVHRLSLQVFSFVVLGIVQRVLELTLQSAGPTQSIFAKFQRFRKFKNQSKLIDCHF